MKEQQQITSIAQLFGTVWFWLVPLAGGIADYVVQAGKGVKPAHPWHVALAALVAHTMVAVVAGVTLALSVGAMGYTGELAYGAAGGIGGFLGVRLFDIGMLFVKLRADSK